MARGNRILFALALCLCPLGALASGWTPSQFPVERIDAQLQGDHLRVILVAAGEDEALEAARAMEPSLSSSHKVVSVQTMGPFSALSDLEIVSSISSFVADVIVVLRIAIDKDLQPQAITTYYHQRVSYPRPMKKHG